MDKDEYHQLKLAGVDFVVLWQETYNKEIYNSLHSSKTKKSDFEYRLNAYERMLNAGIKKYEWAFYQVSLLGDMIVLC
ncbi:MAG: hypothetical protein ISS28_05290 [Candidatus Cloacimonetes bacterium]|nr:hypothetical protein [Candidatus Cloacimonadota bacterium]MBL7086494.1 hypothetical protein [Candidatus Cloacimonadota bacterium]